MTKVKAVTKEQAREALDTLVKYGLTFYKEEYQDKVTKWQAVGQAISKLSDDCHGFAKMLYEALEDWNWYSENCVINWVFGLGFQVYQRDLDSISKLVSRNKVEVVTGWDTDKGEHVKRHARVSVVVEWLD